MSEAAKEILMDFFDRNGLIKELEVQRSREIARKMLEKGMSIEDVAELTGLSPDDLRSLQRLAV